MTTARLTIIADTGHLLVNDSAVSLPDGAVPGQTALGFLEGATDGTRVLLWVDVELGVPVAQLGPPHAAVRAGGIEEDEAMFDALTVWMRADPPVFDDAGDVGGDVQVSAAHSARWERPMLDGNTALVTRYIYEAYLDPDGYVGVDAGRRWIDCQTEYLICADPTDPGGTQQWADYRFRDVEGAAPGDDLHALALAARPPDDDEWYDATDKSGF